MNVRLTTKTMTQFDENLRKLGVLARLNVVFLFTAGPSLAQPVLHAAEYAALGVTIRPVPVSLLKNTARLSST